jgi:hypothetical protein
MQPPCGVAESFLANSTARRFLTRWNECSPLSNIVSKALCRVMEIFSTTQGNRLSWGHYSECNTLVSPCWKRRAESWSHLQQSQREAHLKALKWIKSGARRAVQSQGAIPRRSQWDDLRNALIRFPHSCLNHIMPMLASVALRIAEKLGLLYIYTLILAYMQSHFHSNSPQGTKKSIFDVTIL